MVDIDYTDKIREFQHLTDNYNEDEALTYLEKYDWNEKVSARVLLFIKIINIIVKIKLNTLFYYIESRGQLLDPEKKDK